MEGQSEQSSPLPSDGPITVVGASRATFEVLTEHEQEWFNSNMSKYLEEFLFENVSDLQDLDRLLGLELLSYRYTNWLINGSGFDYEGILIDERAIRAHKKDVDVEIRNMKVSMGMNRKNRVESEQESMADYLRTLLQRAHEFGVHRDHQNAKALDLFNELKTLIGLYARSDDEEQKHLGVSLPDIYRWIVEVAIPEYDEIDAHFRAENQRYWIREVS